METWTYRLASSDDAALFAEWVNNNPQIDPDDVRRTGKDANPSCLFVVACCDGKPVSFAPLYVNFHLAHLAFDPSARAAKKMKSLEVLLDAACSIAGRLGIREITTLTKSAYPMGRTASHLGFIKDDRELFRFNIPVDHSK